MHVLCTARAADRVSSHVRRARDLLSLIYSGPGASGPVSITADATARDPAPFRGSREQVGGRSTVNAIGHPFGRRLVSSPDSHGPVWRCRRVCPREVNWREVHRRGTFMETDMDPPPPDGPVVLAVSQPAGRSHGTGAGSGPVRVSRPRAPRAAMLVWPSNWHVGGAH